MRIMTMDDLGDLGHDLEKSNLVTQRDSAGTYDSYECECGLKGKSRILNTLTIDGRLKVLWCPNAKRVRPKTILVKNFNCSGGVFANIKNGERYPVVEPPSGQDEIGGYWVMGVGEPIKVLSREIDNQ